jgi:hypothetical protein
MSKWAPRARSIGGSATAARGGGPGRQRHGEEVSILGDVEETILNPMCGVILYAIRCTAKSYMRS